MPVSEATYEQVALEDLNAQWELVCGQLRRKPGVTFAHGGVISALHRRLILQLNEREFDVSVNHARLRISTGTYYVPDICIVPHALAEQGRRQTPGRLEVYDEPLPLVVEVWSPSTGEYDVEEKLREYQRRGDLEIWRVHPYERTLTAWRRQPDGAYLETLYREGIVRPASLPAVSIELGGLFGP